MDTNLQRSVDLLKENDDDMRENAECVLLSLCKNITTHPKETKFREVRLDDPIVIEKLLPASGAMECLFEIGFTETEDSLFLPEGAPLMKLQALQHVLIKESSIQPPDDKASESSKLLSISAEEAERDRFFLTMETHFQRVMQYEDPDLLEKARNVIPILNLEIATVSKIRELQKHMKENGKNTESCIEKHYTDNDIDVKGMFLVELVHWFKHKFFSWVSSPKCPTCLKECVYAKTVKTKDANCSRIELYRCADCEIMVKFPRYTDPLPLLTLRRGRCGEWANVFTLLCRSLGYDARIVYDQTDHLWTEVWSMFEKKWIHVDPCENVINRPLMYEKGWKKKLTYIIAFSKDELQDVTWRYTREQEAVLNRRTFCSENYLLQFIESLNKQRQYSSGYSHIRREYVNKRRLLELVELLHVPNAQNVDDDNYEGRTTGPYAWRLARGEITQENLVTNFSWDVSKYGRRFQLYYSIVNDMYKVISEDNTILIEKSGWKEGVSAIEGGMFRKVEHDWKVAYLSRSPESTSGKIKWSFEVINPILCVLSFDLQATTKVFHDARVSWEIEALFDKEDKQVLSFSVLDCNRYHTDALKGAIKLILTATVSGGQGENAWQHAQLFRQSLEADDQSLIITIQLNDR